jgi:hypothetical protein
MYFSVDGQGDRAEQSLELPVSDALTINTEVHPHRTRRQVDWSWRTSQSQR